MNIMLFFWLVVAFIFVLIELGHPGLFFFLSFSFGAVAAGIGALFGYSTIMQPIIFLTFSILAILVLKRFVRNYVHTKRAVETNVDALKGKKAIVTKAIEMYMPGLVKVGGQVWSAKGISGDTIPVGASVIVVNVVGCHLLVQLVDESGLTQKNR